MAKIEAVFFDGDGTLYDTKDYILQTFKATFETYGCPLPSDELIMPEMGKPLRICLQTLAPGTNLEELRDLFLSKDQEFIYLTKLYPFALEVLEELENRGKKKALVTSRHGLTLDAILDQTGVRRYLQVIIGGEDVQNPKPDPEPILKAAELLGVKPESTIMVGDTWVDIAAGQAAKVALVIGFNQGFHQGNFGKFLPNYCINNLREVLEFVK